MGLSRNAQRWRHAMAGWLWCGLARDSAVFEKGGLMARTVYRALSSKRRTTIPRSSATSTGMATSFGRMLAKLTFASDSLAASRGRRRR